MARSDSKPLPKTVNCPHCGHESDPLHPWVYAHWNVELKGICTGCEKEYGLSGGVTYVL